MSVVVAPEDLGEVPDDPSSMRYRTLTSPPIDPLAPTKRWWRAAEIPAANGHGNARSVALVQQIIANNGHANGHRFISERTLQRVFQPVTSGVDLVLGFEGNFGMGYGLSSTTFRSDLGRATGAVSVVRSSSWIKTSNSPSPMT